MSRSYLISLLLLLLPAATAAVEVDPALRQALAAAGPERLIPIHLRLSGALEPSRYSKGREGAGELIVALRARADANRRSLLPLLESAGATEIRFHWIVCGATFRARPALIRELADRHEVESLHLAEAPRVERPAFFALAERSAAWNIDLIDADRVWTELGIDGSGIVVGSMDAGVDADHPALAGKWRGGDNSWLDLISGLPYPYDDTGHGTHTTGTMIGGDGLGPQNFDIGVAPGAQFVAVKMFDISGNPPDIGYIFAAAEWMLDPDGDPGTNDFPHVVNNSWVWAPNDNPVFHPMTAAWLAAGIIPVFSMGNSGPGSDSSQPPGNYNNTIGAAASTQSDEVAYFSSRGPSPYGWAFPADRRKPNLAAPGVDVPSSIPGGGYELGSGTSMAAPHVAGAVALLLQADPALTFPLLKSILEQTAVDIDWPGYDHNAGYGRLDAFAAVNAALAATPAPPAYADPGAASAWPNPFGDTVRIEFSGADREARELELRVHDLRGRLLRSLVGEAAVVWDGRDEHGERLPSGLYPARILRGSDSASLRLLLLR